MIAVLTAKEFCMTGKCHQDSPDILHGIQLAAAPEQVFFPKQEVYQIAETWY